MKPVIAGSSPVGQPNWKVPLLAKPARRAYGRQAEKRGTVPFAKRDALRLKHSGSRGSTCLVDSRGNSLARVVERCSARHRSKTKRGGRLNGKATGKKLEPVLTRTIRFTEVGSIVA